MTVQTRTVIFHSLFVSVALSLSLSAVIECQPVTNEIIAAAVGAGGGSVGLRQRARDTHTAQRGPL